MGKPIALFDFDGVIADTESQYTVFWNRIGKEYLGIEDFGRVIKGQTLIQTFGRYFDGMTKEQQEIEPMLNEFERNMSYDYVPGVIEFMNSLKDNGISMAIVTSSNDVKMANAYKAHPELTDIVDAILTSGHFSRSKPDPECFLKGMEVLDGTPDSTVIFEDSLHGIEAGLASGAYVVGLATTFPREKIAPICNKTITDFTEISVQDLPF